VVDQLGDPADRERLLASIDLRSVGEHHALLRRILQAEMEQRRTGGSYDFFENLYWCAFLLYLVGDPSDVPLMWDAKHLDFDTACGFDVQFLLGAGTQATLAYLTDHGHADIARELLAYPELNDDLQDWVTFRRGYFSSSQD
jgi:hypothetical protein